MENFISTQLQPVETCSICTDVFSAEHQPVTLPCKHIFGHECIKKWLRTGRGNNAACPCCRLVMYEKQDPKAAFDTSSIWKALGEQPPERLHTFMTKMWSGLQALWQQKPDGKFTITELLDQAIVPALVQTANSQSPSMARDNDPFLDCYNLIAASWDSLGRPDTATGLAIPFVRLGRLMSSAGSTLPKWLTTVPRTNRLFWKANACLGITDSDISWDVVMDAYKDLSKTQHFPLLHLYTMLISQGMAHNPQPGSLPTRRHEIMNLVVERCCKKIGGETWTGKPNNEFKEVLVVVYEELRRYQLEKKKASLRGHDGEETLVMGVWALAGWNVKKG
ncbi:hypothetical protein CC86DRAFT_465641 [Ophiobolus disseminans]|uniref:RING-type domain-containing protein n=1 Tax=Ophiobolus disseminans TaxID=1469910 RepID=A0A6A7A5C9_9PLEO|nr:hypothetical protein CC86DRAFT_465641 [Ophiobolus disseminans]